MGMSSREFWDGDVFLTAAYREAEKLKRQQLNERLWLQGLYFYEALCDSAPLFNAGSPKGTKAHPYRTEPYPLTAEDEENRLKKIAEKGKRMLMRHMK